MPTEFGDAIQAPPAGQTEFGDAISGGGSAPEQTFGAALREYGQKMLGALTGPGQAILHPIQAGKAYLAQNEGLANDAERAFKEGRYIDASRHAFNYFLNGLGLGSASDEAGNKLEQGDIAGGLADTAAVATQTALGIKTPAIAKGAARGVTAAGVGLKAAAPDLLSGGTQVAAGEALAKIPGMELPARFGLGYSGARQMAKGIQKGIKAGGAEFRGTPPPNVAPIPLAAEQTAENTASLDDIAKGFNYKDFASVKDPAARQTIQDLAQRLNSGVKSSQPASGPQLVPPRDQGNPPSGQNIIPPPEPGIPLTPEQRAAGWVPPSQQIAPLPPRPYIKLRLPTPEEKAAGWASPSGQDIIRGSSNIPLSEQGRAEAIRLAQATAGQFDEIHTSPLERAQDTARAISSTNPQAGAPQPTEALTPWYLGANEGQPTANVLAKMQDLIKNHPDEVPAGRGPQSTQPGQSFNDFKDEILGHVQNQVNKYQPGQKILNTTHYRDTRVVEAWSKAGAPDDLSIDIPTMMEKGETKPGDLLRLDPQTKQVEAVSDASKPGIYFARHGATAWNAENGTVNPAESVGAPGPAGTQPPSATIAKLNSGAPPAAPETGYFLRNYDLDKIARAIRIKLNKGEATSAQVQQIISSKAGVENLRDQLGLKGRYEPNMTEYLQRKVF